MVSTRQAGKTRKSPEECSLPADSDEEYEERAPEPNKTRGTKRARTAKPTVKGKQQEKRRKKAKLSMLPEMPVDILYEVRGTLPQGVVVDAITLPDIFSRPPEGSNAHLLDGKGAQRNPYQQVIATCLAGFVHHDPEGRAAAGLSFRDDRNGVREPFIWPMLHGPWAGYQHPYPPV